MQIYLPIAELPINMMLILGMGGAVGFISGMFGVGGGFLLTPLLIFSGIPSSVAVATVTSQIVASSTSGVLSYWRRKAVDFKLAFVLLLAGSLGSAVGVWIFGILKRAGQLDLIISVSYMGFLGLIGGIMLNESVRAILASRKPVEPTARPASRESWATRLPLKMRFKRSKLHISIIPVVLLGAGIGFLGSVLGIGGGFIMVPALIYLLHVPASMVVGTSLLQILFTMGVATVLHASSNQSVDVVLGFILMVGGVIGAQIGAAIGQKMRGEQLRLLLALLVLAVGVRFAVNLILEPDDLFSLAPIG
jgi:uncharacterized membrane protein YfcA